MATNYKAKGDVLQYTCGAAEEVSSGDVLFVNGIPGVAIHDIGNDESGSIAISGVWEVDKRDESDHEAEFNQGDPVFWDAEEKEAVANPAFPMLGFAYEAADDDDDTVKVLLAGNPKDAPIPVKDGTGTGLLKYDLVYPSGYDADKNVIEVSKAEANGTAPARVAWYILPEAISSNELGIAKRSLLATDVNTNNPSPGDPVYLSTTAGQWTENAPSSGGDTVQQVGIVTIEHSSDGEILFMVGDSKAYTVNS